MFAPPPMCESAAYGAGVGEAVCDAFPRRVRLHSPASMECAQSYAVDVPWLHRWISTPERLTRLRVST